MLTVAFFFPVSETYVLRPFAAVVAAILGACLLSALVDEMCLEHWRRACRTAVGVTCDMMMVGMRLYRGGDDDYTTDHIRLIKNSAAHLTELGPPLEGLE